MIVVTRSGVSRLATAAATRARPASSSSSSRRYARSSRTASGMDHSEPFSLHPITCCRITMSSNVFTATTCSSAVKHLTGSPCADAANANAARAGHSQPMTSSTAASPGLTSPTSRRSCVVVSGTDAAGSRAVGTPRGFGRAPQVIGLVRATTAAAAFRLRTGSSWRVHARRLVGPRVVWRFLWLTENVIRVGTQVDPRHARREKGLRLPRTRGLRPAYPKHACVVPGAPRAHRRAVQ